MKVNMTNIVWQFPESRFKGGGLPNTLVVELEDDTDLSEVDAQAKYAAYRLTGVRVISADYKVRK